MRQCEQQLRVPLTDWDELYFHLKASPLGGDFPKEVFLRTPVAVIRKALGRVASFEQEQANVASVSTARLTSVLINVAHGFSGSKGPPPKIKVQDFLPYPDWKPEKAENQGPSEITSAVLVTLFRERRIPAHVFAALKSPVSE